MISRRQVQWLLAGALLAGISGGVLWPPPPASDSSDHEIPWALPPVSDLQRHVSQDMATVSRDMPWSIGSPVEEPDDVGTSHWRLAGIVHEQRPLILVLIPDQPGRIQRIHIGESLPDDSVLDAVENDRALIRRGECVTTWRLFHPHPIATSDACQAAVEPPTQGTSS